MGVYSSLLLRLLYHFTFNFMSFMSSEFSPKPQSYVAEDMNVKKISEIEKNINANPGGRLMVYKSIADEVYANALNVADSIDDREETNVPYRRNAVYLASLLSTVCIRGKEIS